MECPWACCNGFVPSPGQTAWQGTREAAAGTETDRVQEPALKRLRRCHDVLGGKEAVSYTHLTLPTILLV
eukprot:1522986-Amphidinium_carterae.1